MTFQITFENSGGPLDVRTADTEDQAALVAIEMIRSAGSLCGGDRIVITEDDEMRRAA